MYFSFISIIIAAVLALPIIIAAFKGFKHGLNRSLITLAALIISTALASVGAFFLANLLDTPAYNLLKRFIPIIRQYSDKLNSINTLGLATVNAILKLFSFVILLALLFIISCIVIAICFSRRKRSTAEDSRYTPDSAPFYVRHSKGLGASVRALTAFLAVIIFFSPIFGALTILGDVIDVAEKQNFKWESIRIKSSAVEFFDPYFDDATVAIVGFAGSQAVFDAFASAKLPGVDRIYLSREAGICCEALSTLLISLQKLSKGKQLTDEQLLELKSTISEQIESSPILQVFTADMLNSVANAWLNDQDFLSIKRPELPATGNIIFEKLFDQLLLACAESTPECAGRDMLSLFSLYEILSSVELNGDLIGPDQFLNIAESDVIGRIMEVLESNECLADCCAMIKNIALDYISIFIQDIDLTAEKRNRFMNKLASTVNTVNNMDSASNEEKIKLITNVINEYITVPLPPATVNVAVGMMLSRLQSSTELDSSTMSRFFEYYANDGEHIS